MHSAATTNPNTDRFRHIRRAVGAALILTGMASLAAAGQPAMHISHAPHPATDHDRVTIYVEGTHHNGCVPHFDDGYVYDHQRTIELYLESANGHCTQAVTPWAVQARTNAPLTAGWWTVVVKWGHTSQNYRFEVRPKVGHESRIGFSHGEFDVSESAHTAYLVVERTGSSEGSVSVDYETWDGSAKAGADYQYTAGTLTWHHGDTTPKKIAVRIWDDHHEEQDEFFEVRLSNLSGSAVAGTYWHARVTIQDDDGHRGSGCVSDAYTLCLLENRFEVTARWRTRDGKSGRGQAHSLTPQSGYFWFFSESNVEVLVKMVDGCSLSRSHWVFVSGMTNVWVEITVRDTWTSQHQSWTNPMGQDFRLIKDTSRFDQCQ